MHRLAADFRLALRTLRHAPTFTATSIGILAIAIGMSVAMFSVYRAVLVQQLPIIEQDRVVVMWPVRDGNVEYAPGKQVLDQFRHETRTLTGVAGVVHWGATAAPFNDGERTVQVSQGIVTSNFFEVLGVRPLLGRLLRNDDDIGGRFQSDSFRALPHPMVLSYRAWHRDFGGDSTVLGRRLVDPYSRWTYTVVGVAPPGLDYPAGVDEWVPLGRDASTSTIAVGRLRPGVAIASARDEYLRSLRANAPELAGVSGAVAHTLREEMLGNVRPALVILTVAVGVLLFIACINVGNLLLLRAAGRAREIAIRRAIGASYVDIVRQLVVESTVLAAAGGALGLACAVGLLRVLIHFAPPQLPRIDVVRVEGAPVAVAVVTTALAVLCFGVLPALFAARADSGALRFDTRSGLESRTRRRLRELLVASQVALALVMIAGAGLLGRSLARLQQLDLGYEAEHLSFFAVSLAGDRYGPMPARMAMGDQVLSRVRAIPGVVAVTPVIIPPLLGPNVFQLRVEVDGQSPDEAKRNPPIPVEAGSADYFRTLGLSLVRGVGFVGPDVDGAPLEVVVSESAARRFWPGQDPIGKRIRTDSAWRTVVGVAREIHLRSLRESTPTIFMRWRQAFWQGNFAIRTTSSITTVLPALRRAVREVDPQLTVWQAQSMEDFLAQPLAQPRLGALLLSVFGFVAVVLAAAGLYGVMASVVREQTRDIGIRMALGATPARVRGDVMTHALGVIGIGAVVGLASALAGGRVWEALLFQVSPTDPTALLGACALLFVVGVGAAYIPARRATRIDPAQALRTE